MVRFGKKVAVLTLAGAIAAMSVTGCGSIKEDATVATVGEEKITLGVANFYARLQQGQYETYYAGMMGTTGEAMWSQDASDGKDYEEQTKDNIMESLENLYLLSQHASEYNVSLSDDEKKAIKDAAEQFGKDNTDQVKDVVSGSTDTIEKLLELLTIQNKMDTAIKDTETVTADDITDDEAAQKSMQYVLFSYTTKDDSGNSTTLSDDEKETLKTTAQNFVDSVKGGADFGTAATEAGVEAQTATFDSESTSPNSDLIAAANALANEGDVTEVIETDKGLYVAKLTSLLDREATDSKKASIVTERKQEKYDEVLKGWKEDTKIKVVKKEWKKVDFKDQGITITTSKTSDTGSDTGSDSGSDAGSDAGSDSGSN